MVESQRWRRLCTQYFESDTQEETPPSFTIYGIGGVGKSALARRYAQQQLENRAYDAVFWIRSEALAAIQDFFLEIARRIGVTSSANIDLTITKVMDWLSKTSEYQISPRDVYLYANDVYN